jgi:N-acetylglutamate synthase-like GNAT family acetyltransferase
VRVLDGDPAEAGFVVVGWDRSADYDRLRTASVLVGRGAHLVATNADASYPAPGDDLWPGAGALLAAVETATGTTAEVVGKPHRPLFDAAVDRAGTRSALMVGDRIETDVVGAADAGLDSALVLTGAARAATLLDRGPPPTILAEDLAGLLVERPDARIRDAAPDDRPAISALLEAASLDPSEDGEGTVVAGDGDVVATAAADVRGREAYLRSVAVREEARGQRFGVLVSWAAIRDAARRGARRAFLLTETAEGFFARLGFEAVDRSDVPGWILERTARCWESAAAMARDLRA